MVFCSFDIFSLPLWKCRNFAASLSFYRNIGTDEWMDVVTIFPLHLYTFLSASLCKLLSMYSGSLCKRICSKTIALSFHLCSVLFLSFLSGQVQKYPDKPSINRVYFVLSVCCNSLILRLTVSSGCVLFHPR